MICTGSISGGDAVHSLGFQFVLTPVLLNTLAILAVAAAFSFPFPRRRYPVGWVRLPSAPQEQADFIAALGEMDQVADVTEQDKLRIYELVTRAGKQRGSPN